MNWKKTYKTLGALYKLNRHPNFHVDVDHAADYVVMPKVTTANGLTKAIINFLTWKGFYANRINTQGQVRIHKIPRWSGAGESLVHSDQVRFNKSTTKRGTPDISAIIHGRAVWIEVKIGRDRMSEQQLEQQSHIEEAGGIFYIATNMDDFYEWYCKTWE